VKKLFLLLPLYFFPLIATLAASNDFECEFQSRDQSRVEIITKASFTPNARLIITKYNDNSVDTFEYYVFTRADPPLDSFSYNSKRVRLIIDIWPDERPRRGRKYRGNFNSLDLDEGSYYPNISCGYTGLTFIN